MGSVIKPAPCILYTWLLTAIISPMSNVEVREVPIEVIVEVNKTITEFDEAYSANHFQNRYNRRPHLLIVGYVDDQPAGYVVGYDRDKDGSFYCWMAGVNPAYRRRGVLGALMQYQDDWAKQHGYTFIKIKTRNARREMLANLVKQGYLFTGVEAYPKAIDNRISLEKPL